MLDVRNLEVAYGRAVVLDDLSFTVGQGEIVALLGTNGAGKSTLLKAISGVLPARSGTVTFDGVDITGARPNRIVGAGLVQMPGGRATFPGLDMERNAAQRLHGAVTCIEIIDGKAKCQDKPPARVGRP